MALYAKSRRTGWAALLLLALGLAAWAWGRYQLRLPSVRYNGGILVPVTLLVPLACAVVAGLGTHTWMSDLERSSPRRMAMWRFAHALLLCAVGVVVMLPAAGLGNDLYAAEAVRNILGYTGLAYLCAAAMGGELSWVLPLTYGLAVPLLGVDQYRHVLWWAWPLQTAGSQVSWAWAALLLIAGTAAFVFRAPAVVEVGDEQ